MRDSGKRKLLFWIAAVLLSAADGMLVMAAERRKSAPQKTSAGVPLQGANVDGRTGLVFTDTAQTVGSGRGSVTTHLIMATDDDFDQISIPIGVQYGPASDVELHGSLDLVSLDPDRGDNESGLGTLTASGRWILPIEGRDLPKFGIELDISHGPLSDDLGPDGTDVNLKGMVTHVFAPQSLLLNGGLGILHVGERDVRVVTPFGTVTAESDSDTVIQINGGVAYPLTPRVTGMAELAINQFGDDAGAISFGVRSRGSSGIALQGLLSLGVGDDAPDLSIGGGFSLPFGG